MLRAPCRPVAGARRSWILRLRRVLNLTQLWERSAFRPEAEALRSWSLQLRRSAPCVSLGRRLTAVPWARATSCIIDGQLPVVVGGGGVGGGADGEGEGRWERDEAIGHEIDEAARAHRRACVFQSAGARIRVSKISVPIGLSVPFSSVYHSLCLCLCLCLFLCLCLCSGIRSHSRSVCI